MEYFKYLGSKVTNDARCTWNIVYRISMANAAFSKKAHFTSKLDLSVRKKLLKCYIWRITLCGAEPWALRNVDYKYLQSFEVWCWRRMEKISLTDCVIKVLHKVREKRNLLHTIEKAKT